MDRLNWYRKQRKDLMFVFFAKTNLFCTYITRGVPHDVTINSFPRTLLREKQYGRFEVKRGPNLKLH